ncbi:hypothetical protein GP644_04525 [Parasedimentitalea maritima]|uniref:LysR substrate-binding domain-containing protein n=2 Tax=Parasedimentitalea maritima TaxID=2578117 RepID=A0A6A4RLF4_9RHOB|nr:hypothetical protein GP644_04525 [Zongyanglinia marina]
MTGYERNRTPRIEFPYKAENFLFQSPTRCSSRFSYSAIAELMSRSIRSSRSSPRSVNSLEALHAACCAGRGIAWLPEFLISHDLYKGHLEPVLIDHADAGAGGGIFILRPETSFLTSRVRALIDFLTDQFH